MALNDRFFGDTYHLHFQHLDRFGELALRAATHADLDEIVLMLRRVFPGNNIVWHSYPSLDVRSDTKGDCARIHCNLMYAKINDLISASIRKLNATTIRGVSFVSLWDLQTRRFDEYDDMIHHNGGKLGNDIVKRLLLPNSVNDDELFDHRTTCRRTSFLAPRALKIKHE